MNGLHAPKRRITKNHYNTKPGGIFVAVNSLVFEHIEVAIKLYTTTNKMII